MKAARAWVAQLGQRRSVEVAVPQGFAGSNPAPRIRFPRTDGTREGVPSVVGPNASNESFRAFTCPERGLRWGRRSPPSESARVLPTLPPSARTRLTGRSRSPGPGRCTCTRPVRRIPSPSPSGCPRASRRLRRMTAAFAPPVPGPNVLPCFNAISGCTNSPFRRKTVHGSDNAAGRTVGREAPRSEEELTRRANLARPP